jgi:hypothetical protein
MKDSGSKALPVKNGEINFAGDKAEAVASAVQMRISQFAEE